mmetsp:Transcript_29108/g.90003  ORF Transcript_29108/g.90003 Transcript_29108/m.90003 type:complete len:235 (+) Transcript_29108:460-1164(+)
MSVALGTRCNSTKTFSGLTSRCAILFSWRYASASQSCFINGRASCSARACRSRMTSKSSRPSTFVITSRSASGPDQTPTYATTCGCRSLLRMHASRSSRFGEKLGRRRKGRASTVFTASSLPVARSTKLETTLNAPLPSTSQRSKRVSKSRGSPSSRPAADASRLSASPKSPAASVGGLATSKSQLLEAAPRGRFCEWCDGISLRRAPILRRDDGATRRLVARRGRFSPTSGRG